MPRFALVCFLFLTGCSQVSNPASGVSPSTSVEAIVAKHIVDNANDPKSVEFAKWGPNLLMSDLTPVQQKQFWSALATWKDGEQPKGFVRVAYREKNVQGALELRDLIVLVLADGRVNMWTATEGGDQWRDSILKGFGK
jgi:hypothetical protein